MDCSDNDGEALFALCLLYAAIKNQGKFSMTSITQISFISYDAVTSKKKKQTALSFVNLRVEFILVIISGPMPEEKSLHIFFYLKFGEKECKKILLSCVEFLLPTFLANV